MEYSKIKGQFKLRAKTFDDSARWIKDKGLLDLHYSLAQVNAGDLILEVCCGTGVVGQRLLQNGSKVIGLDLSLSMLGSAKKRLSFCANGQAEQIPFRNNIFDAVVCRQAFHFLDIKQSLNEILRITKPGARVVISQIVPFSNEDRDWLYQIHRKKQPLLKNFLTEHELKCLIENAGFKNFISREYFIEEPITSWLADTYFSESEKNTIKDMFLNAPLKYKVLHQTKVVSGDVFDTMRWVVLSVNK